MLSNRYGLVFAMAKRKHKKSPTGEIEINSYRGAGVNHRELSTSDDLVWWFRCLFLRQGFARLPG